MKYWKIYLMIAILSVMGLGCGKNKLTRTKAAKMIAKKCPIPVEYTFLGSWTHVDEFIEFEKKGWLSGVRVGRDFIGRTVLPGFWTITEKGRKYFGESIAYFALYDDGWRIE